jgi:hypothetical protein
MSTRTITVKTNNKQQSFNNKPSSVTAPTIPAVKKNSHTNQPKKNQQQKLLATNKKNHGRKNQQKKISQVVVALVEDDSSSSSSSSSSSEDDSQVLKQQPKRRNSTHNNKHHHHQFEYKSFVDQVYAGPTFNNAPAPSALPIPAFNARGSPINYPQPLYQNPYQQQSIDLMNLINAPQKVVTAYELERTNLALSEIQRGLRSMLKIES